MAAKLVQFSNAYYGMQSNLAESVISVSFIQPLKTPSTNKVSLSRFKIFLRLMQVWKDEKDIVYKSPANSILSRLVQ